MRNGISGGQRQRVAIARELFTNPRVLIFDKATSALDYESEAIIQKNMAHIATGRTVLIIAHRLSAVRNAHRIIVMDRGNIVESGPHNELVHQPQGLYAHLWRMQDGGKPLKGLFRTLPRACRQRARHEHQLRHGWPAPALE